MLAKQRKTPENRQSALADSYSCLLPLLPPPHVLPALPSQMLIEWLNWLGKD